MQIVIDIPEGMLDELHTCKFPIHEAYRLCKIIEDGKPLPKGHGRLIDADDLLRYIDSMPSELNVCAYRMIRRIKLTDYIQDSAQTIIGADEEGKNNAEKL